MFYTYAHYKKDDGKIFYIGKGKGNRSHQITGRNNWWRNVVEKHGLEIKILCWWKNESDAFEHEKLLISCFRELGVKIVNICNGGQGSSGFSHSEEWKKALSIKTKGRPGKPVSEDTKKKLSEIVKANPPMYWLGKKKSAETIALRTKSRYLTTHKILEDGMNLTITEWAKKLNLHQSTIRYRLSTGKTPSGKVV